jgi:hypothetical protein
MPKQTRDKQISLATVTTTGVQAASTHLLRRQKGYLLADDRLFKDERIFTRLFMKIKCCKSLYFADPYSKNGRPKLLATTHKNCEVHDVDAGNSTS